MKTLGDLRDLGDLQFEEICWNWNCCRFTWQVFEGPPESYLSPSREAVWGYLGGRFDGSPYLQHRVATLLVQHGRRHQNHPTRNPFLKSCCFRLCLIQAAVVNLFVLNLVCFISVCPCIPETGRLENTYSCCVFCFGLAGCCCQLVCFEFVVLHFRLPIPETLNGQIVEHVLRTEKKQKRPCPAVQGT